MGYVFVRLSFIPSEAVAAIAEFEFWQMHQAIRHFAS
jgi:hypothetical protein